VTSARTTRGPRALPAAVAVATAVALTTLGMSIPASASAFALPPTGAGIDVSYPQCSANSHVELSGNVPFAVVGVNGGRANTVNPCFLAEYNSALLLSGQTEQPHAAVYVNTGNPALAATWWPTTDRTQAGTTVVNPDGSCTHLAGAACAYVYGYSMAQADYRRVRREVARLPELWWLDVETSNAWQADVVANSASLTAMVDFFQGQGLAVGLYSTSYQWNRIAGSTAASSSLASLRSWLAGASEVGAPAGCERSPLTPGGWVSMVQYVGLFDNDVSCRRFGAVGATIVSTDSPVGELSAVAGVWAAGSVSYLYQWSRDGVPIAGATGATYDPISADVGTSIAVTITGIASGYSTTSFTSSAVPVLPNGLAPE
jgi:hypothetical protein